MESAQSAEAAMKRQSVITIRRRRPRRSPRWPCTGAATVAATRSETTTQEMLPSTTFELPDHQDSANAEHRRIVEAIEKDDPQAAELAAREHIEVAAVSRFSMMFETPSQRSPRPTAQRMVARPK